MPIAHGVVKAAKAQTGFDLAVNSWLISSRQVRFVRNYVSVQHVALISWLN